MTTHKEEVSLQTMMVLHHLLGDNSQRGGKSTDHDVLHHLLGDNSQRGGKSTDHDGLTSPTW